jgi:hypothetical protein
MDPALINTYNKEGCTPLLFAVEEERGTETVTLLIKYGADVHARCSLGRTPLFSCTEPAVTRVLLEADADVHARDYLCNTVLHNAAARGLSAGVICSLLKADADACTVNTHYDTAAEVAEVHKHTAAAALLRRAGSDQSNHFKQQQRAPMLPMHLLLNPDHPGWRLSTDMTARCAVFGRLSGLALLDTELDKIELVQCVEFELYSAATDLAEYRDLNTVVQRAAAVLYTVRAGMQERAVESETRVLLEKMLANKQKQEREQMLALDRAAERTDSRADGDSVQQHSGAASTTQQLHNHAVLQHVSDQRTDVLTDAADGSGDADRVVACIQSAVPKQQQQQQHLIKQQQAAEAAAMTTVAAAVNDSCEQSQCVTSDELAAADDEQQAVVDTTADADMHSPTAVLRESSNAAETVAISAGTAVEASSNSSDATTAEIACDTIKQADSNQAGVSAREITVCDTPVAAAAAADSAAVAAASAAAVPDSAEVGAAAVAAAAAAASARSVEPLAAAHMTVVTSSISSGAIADSGSSDSIECTCCDATLHQDLRCQSQRAAAAEQHAEAASQAAVWAASAAVSATDKVAQLKASLAVAVKAAAAAATEAAKAFTAQAAALEQMHVEQELLHKQQRQQQQREQQCAASAHRSVAAASTVATAVSAAVCVDAHESDDECDDDDDCPPLALAARLIDDNGDTASTMAAASEAAVAVAALVATVTAATESHDDGSAHSVVTVSDSLQQQHKQSAQQPCVQCGTLTKKRCRRCQAVYYCSEECQIQCFKDPAHRAACEAAASSMRSSTIIKWVNGKRGSGYMVNCKRGS